MAGTTPGEGPDRHYVDYDEYVDFQIEKARGHIKATDVFTTLTMVTAAFVGYLLLFVVFDQWVFEGGFSDGVRAGMLALVLLVLGTIVVRRVVLPLIRRVHPLYAARMLEQADPNLQSNLLNFVDVRESNGTVSSPSVLRAMEKRAAVELSHIDVDEAIDRRPLLRVAYALLGIVVVSALYVILSPKDPFVSVRRALNPASKLDVATRTMISEVTPGDDRVPARSTLTIEADIRGPEADNARILFSTADNKYVDQAVEMRRIEEGLPRYRGVLNGENGRGLLQSLSYSIVAGDARTQNYSIEVVQPPSARVEEVKYVFPPYMQLTERTNPGGNIDGWEGATVTLSATANMPVKSAAVVMTDSEDPHAKGEEVPMMVVDGTKLTAKWKLEFRNDGTFPRYHHVQVKTARGEADPDPTVYTVRIRPDQRPEVTLLFPTGDLKKAPNAVIPLSVSAADPDFGLRSITLKAERNGEEIVSQPLFEGEDLSVSYRGNFDWDLAKSNLRPGDAIQFWIEAKDTKQPVANRGMTPRLRLDILNEKKSAEEVRQDLADEKKKQNDQIARADGPKNDERRESAERNPGDDKLTESQPDERGRTEKTPPREGERQPPKPDEAQAKPKNGAREPDNRTQGADEPSAPQERRPGDDPQKALERMLQRQAQEQEREREQAQKEQRQERNQNDRSEDSNDKSQGSQGKGNDKKAGNSKSNPSSDPSKEKNQGSEANKSSDGGNKEQPANSGKNQPNGNQSKKSADQAKSGQQRQEQGTGQENSDKQNASDKKPEGEKQGNKKPEGDQQGKSNDKTGQSRADDQKPGQPKAQQDPKEKSKDDSQQNKEQSQSKNSQPSGQGKGDGSDKGDKQDKQGDGTEKGSSDKNSGSGEKPGDKGTGGDQDKGLNEKNSGDKGDKGGKGDDQKPAGDKPNDKNATSGKSADKEQPDKEKGESQEKQGKGSEKGPASDGAGEKQSASSKGEGDQGTPKPSNGSNAKKSDDATKPDSDPQSQGGGKGKEQTDGTKQPAADAPDAKKGQATGNEQGEATGSKEKDPDAVRAKNDLERRPDSERGETQASKDPENAKPGERRKPQDGTSSATDDPKEVRRDPDGVKEKPEQPGKIDDPASEKPEKKGTSEKERRPGEPPDVGNQPQKGEGRPQRQASDQPNAGEKGESAATDQGQEGANKEGAGDKSDEAGDSERAKRKTGAAGDKPGTGSTSKPSEKGSGSKAGGEGKEPGAGESQSAGEGSEGKGQGEKPGSGQSQQGSGKASGEGEKGSDSSQPGGSAGKGSGTPGNSSSRTPGGGSSGPLDRPQQEGPGQGGTAPGDRPDRDSSEPPTAEEEQANLDYAREASNLLLSRLRKQLERGEVDQNLLDEMGWKDASDVVRFKKWLEENLQSQADDDSPEARARRLQFEETLKGMRLRSETETRKGDSKVERRVQPTAVRDLPVPPQYREQREAYTKSLAKQNQEAEKKAAAPAKKPAAKR